MKKHVFDVAGARKRKCEKNEKHKHSLLENLIGHLLQVQT